MPAAHPRVSGENQVAAALEKFNLGSSPRERGKPGKKVFKADHFRLIPA